MNVFMAVVLSLKACFFSCLIHSQLQSKLENAEVLELTVKRVESILQNRAQGRLLPPTFECYYIQTIVMLQPTITGPTITGLS